MKKLHITLALTLSFIIFLTFSTLIIYRRYHNSRQSGYLGELFADHFESGFHSVFVTPTFGRGYPRSSIALVPSGGTFSLRNRQTMDSILEHIQNIRVTPADIGEPFITEIAHIFERHRENDYGALYLSFVDVFHGNFEFYYFEVRVPENRIDVIILPHPKILSVMLVEHDRRNFEVTQTYYFTYENLDIDALSEIISDAFVRRRP